LIIRISLLLILSALPVFLGVELLLWLAMSSLASGLTLLGSAMLLSGFVALLGIGLGAILKAISRAIVDYFSSKQRIQRRSWFVQARQQQLDMLFHFKTRQIQNVHERHKNRLLTRNNQKHLRLLSSAIAKQLLFLKTKLSATTYRQLQQEHARYRVEQDLAALISLQQKIASL
jgi:hypothetical protein